MNPLATSDSTIAGYPKISPARMRHDDGRDEAQRGDEDDVDLRMPEEPEHVLVQQRIAAFGRIDEMRADGAVRQKEGARDHHGGHREDHHERLHQHGPAEHGNAVQATCRARAF